MTVFQEGVRPRSVQFRGRSEISQIPRVQDRVNFEASGSIIQALRFIVRHELLWLAANFKRLCIVMLTFSFAHTNRIINA